MDNAQHDRPTLVAPQRLARLETSAADFLPEDLSLAALKRKAAGCRGCHLYERATQTVFGDGLVRSRLMLVGEMAGDEEDKAGRPFVGPAGRELDRALEDAGVDRDDAYVTNVVKHFKWTPKGGRRLHKKPGAREIDACLPWLEAEIEVVRPEVIVCLGATAAKTLIGSDFRVTRQHGELMESPLATRIMGVHHPSSILRRPSSEDRQRARERLVENLQVVAAFLDGG